MATNKPIKTTTQNVGGTYNASGVTLADGDQMPLQLDVNGGVKISGSISATNPSVSATGAAVPASATAIGWQDGSGNLQIPSATNPLPISGSITTNPADMLNITGTISSAAVLSNFPKTDCTGYYEVSVEWTTVTSGNTGVAEWSNDGSTWTTSVDEITGASSVTAAGVAIYPCYGKQFRLRCSVYASGSVAANAQFRGNVYARNVNASQTGAWTVTANAGTNLNTSLLALESGGNLATLAGAITSSVMQSNTKQVNGVATSTGAGAVGTGSQRVAVGQDTTTIAGSAPGTAGTASANVVTVQGIASMTKLLVTPDALPANQSVNVAQIAGATTNTGHGTASGSLRVELPTDGTGVVGLNAGSATIGKVDILGNGGASLDSASNASGLATNALSVKIADAAGNNRGANVDASNNLTVNINAQSFANLSTNVAQFGGTNVVNGGTAGLVGVGGPTASGSSVTGNPVQVGGRAATAYPTAVADGQAVEAMFNKAGRAAVVLNAPRDLKTTTVVSTTDSSSHTLIASGAAGVFNDIVGLVITNTSGTGTYVTIGDGTNNHVFSAPANDTRGISISDGLIATSAATAWTIQSNAGVSTIYCTVTYVKNK